MTQQATHPASTSGPNPIYAELTREIRIPEVAEWTFSDPPSFVADLTLETLSGRHRGDEVSRTNAAAWNLAEPPRFAAEVAGGSGGRHRDEDTGPPDVPEAAATTASKKSPTRKSRTTKTATGQAKVGQAKVGQAGTRKAGTRKAAPRRTTAKKNGSTSARNTDHNDADSHLDASEEAAS